MENLHDEDYVSIETMRLSVDDDSFSECSLRSDSRNSSEKWAIACQILAGEDLQSPDQTIRKRRRGRPTNCSKCSKVQSISAMPKTKKKNEEKDKYWLRIFRAYVKEEYPRIRAEVAIAELPFWEKYVSRDGEPRKHGEFPSYNRFYKEYLFSVPSFQERFNTWFYLRGKSELQYKYPSDPTMRDYFFDYAEQHLVHYTDEVMNKGCGSPLREVSSAHTECGVMMEMCTQEEMAEDPDYFLARNIG